MRARKWDFEAAKSMLFESETWRREFKVDELYENFSFPEKEAVNELYPKFYHKTDKDGRPVYIEQLGKLDLNKLFNVTTPERLIQELVYEYEKCLNERLPVCSAINQNLIETSCTVMDLKNVGIGQFWKVSSYVQQASKIGQCYYPETMGRFYIINAPYIFTTVWTVVKAWLDPVTREKIQILGSNYIGELAKQIPMENIPSLIGGKCQCQGGCMMSDAGPWNTPEGEEIIRTRNEEKRKIKNEYLGMGGKEPPARVEAASHDQSSTALASVHESKDSKEQKESNNQAEDHAPMVSASAALSKKKVSNSNGVDESSESKKQEDDAQSTKQANSSGEIASHDILNESVATARISSKDSEPHAAPSLSEPGSDGLAPPTTAQPLSNAIASTKH